MRVLRSQSGEQPGCDLPRFSFDELNRGFLCVLLNVATSISLVKGLAWIFFAATFIFMRGRPKLGPAEYKADTLRIRLTNGERELLDKAAGGRTSTWARELLLRAAERECLAVQPKKERKRK